VEGSITEVVDKPRKAVLQLLGFKSTDISKSLHFPATKRELLDKLPVQVVVFRDRIEVKAIFTIEPIYSQKYTSHYQGEGNKPP
jgi:hypothetical protein